MNQYPVVFLTLKDIDGLTFEDAYERLAVQISNLYKEHTYLLESERMDSDAVSYTHLYDDSDWRTYFVTTYVVIRRNRYRKIKCI